ncbi:MAG TPA: ABC transporter substrate-binding protein [Burkholderiaceae bacterium]
MKHLALALAFLLALFAGNAFARQEVTIGIGIQNTTTNTVTGGAVIQHLGLLEKYLPRTGKYKDIDFRLDWQNFTSGPPITNGMMANRLQIGMMGDYPLLVAGATGQSQPGNETALVAVIAYNAFGSGNGIVVHKDSPYYRLEDLKGKVVSVPFGSAAHGMVLQALQARGLPPDFFQLVSQSPEVGTTNLQERKIDAHADFVPFADLLPYRGFARKIFDGVQTKVPTFHGVIVRKDFARQYPEVVVAYIRALIDANAWVRANPAQAAAKIEEWTHVEKEVAYLYLGPSGIHTLDPTIKPRWLDTIRIGHEVLAKLNRVKPLDVGAWVDESYVREAFKLDHLDYEAQKQTLANYEIGGTDAFCRTPITRPQQAGEVWLDGAGVSAYSSPLCTLGAIHAFEEQHRKVRVAYLMDNALGIKLFADKAFFAVDARDPKKPLIVPFLLKADAEAEAQRIGGRLATYPEALAAAAAAF